MARPTPQVKSVDQLKSSILSPATTSNYICRFAFPSGGGKEFTDLYKGANQELLEISCSEASLPGSSLATLDIDNSFHGVSEKMAYRKIYDDRADFTFIVDRDYFAIKYFEKWISFIVGETGGDVNVPALNPAIEQDNYSYRVKYPEAYRTDQLYITKFEKDHFASSQVQKTATLVYKFIGAYPISIVSMPISYDQSQLLKCTVSFTYLRYVVNPVEEPIEATPAGSESSTDGQSLPIQNQSLNSILGANDIPSSIDLGLG